MKITKNRIICDVIFTVILITPLIIALRALDRIAKADEVVALSPSEQEFFETVNTYRTAHGLGELTPDPALMSGARRWATFHGRSHEGSGYSGECISHHASGGESAFNNWMASKKGHREMMLSNRWKYAGFGHEKQRAVLRLSAEPWGSRTTSTTSTAAVQQPRRKPQLLRKRLR
jgi:hypothetical protein